VNFSARAKHGAALNSAKDQKENDFSFLEDFN
jgi:hypothetical protein